MRECHLHEMEGHEEVEKEDKQKPTRKEENKSDTKEDGIYKRPYQDCKKKLPTWKGIVNHCYNKH